MAHRSSHPTAKAIQTRRARTRRMRPSFAGTCASLLLLLAACGETATTADLPIPPSPIERCVTVDHAMASGPVPGTWTQHVTQSDLQAVASAGFDTVRLPVPLAAHTAEAAPFTIDAAALSRLDTLVDWALSANLTVILTLDGFDALETDVSGQSGRLNRIWVQLAEHFRDQRSGLVFELLDPPGEALAGKAMDQLNQVILSQLRQVDGSRWVILPSGNGNRIEALARAQPPADRRTLLAFSYFEPEDFTRPTPEAAASAEWGSMAEFQAMLDAFETADEVRQRIRQPVLLGAFGVDGAVPDVMRARWVRAVRRAAESQGFGWCHAGFGGEDGIFDLETGRWSPELVEALFRDGMELN